MQDRQGFERLERRCVLEAPRALVRLSRVALRRLSQTLSVEGDFDVVPLWARLLRPLLLHWRWVLRRLTQGWMAFSPTVRPTRRLRAGGPGNRPVARAVLCLLHHRLHRLQFRLRHAKFIHVFDDMN